MIRLTMIAPIYYASLPLTPVTNELFGDHSFLLSQYSRLDGHLNGVMSGSESPTSSPTFSAKGQTQDSECKVNKRCAKLGIVGDCCPTPEGVYLDCCDAVSPAVELPMANGTLIKAADIPSEWKSLMLDLYGSM